MTGSEVMDLRVSKELSDNCRGLFAPLSRAHFFLLPSSPRLFESKSSTTNAVPAPGNPEKSAMQSTTNSFPFPSALLRSHRISRSFNFSPLPFVAYAYVQPFGLQLLISRHTLYTLCFVYHVRVFKF